MASVNLRTQVWLMVLGVLVLVANFVPGEAKREKSGKTQFNGKRVAILVDEGFEQVEMTRPRKALDDVGAKTFLIAPKLHHLKAWNRTNWGDLFTVDVLLEKAKPENFDALLIPGGVMSPDKLRMDPKAVAFVKAFWDEGKPIAAICHGPWMLVEAGVVKGLKLTSWPSLKTDIKNAGGTWVDEPVVCDRGVVTSRKPADISQFAPKIIQVFGQGKRYSRR